MILFNAIGAVKEVNEFFKILKPEITRPKLNILISFPYIRGQVSSLIKYKEQNMIGQLFLDAGTFTINIKSTTLHPLPKPRFAEYMQYVKLYGHHFDHIASYDEDFYDPDLNMHHLLRSGTILGDDLMRKLIPVVHEANDGAAKELQDIVDLDYDYIAIGSQPKLKKNVWDKIEKIIREQKVLGREIKTHLFGIMSPKILMDKKPHSADSSSFAKVGGQDAILYWNPETKMLDTVRLIDLSDPEMSRKDSRKEWLPIHDDYLSRIFIECTKNRLIAYTTDRHLVSLYAIVQMEKYFTDLANQPVQPVSTNPE